MLSSLALAVSGLVLVLVLVLGGLAYIYGGAPYVMSDPVGGYSSMYTPGRVTDASGAVVTDAGTYDRPATLGEHTLSWPTVSGQAGSAMLEQSQRWDQERRSGCGGEC